MSDRPAVGARDHVTASRSDLRILKSFAHRCSAGSPPRYSQSIRSEDTEIEKRHSVEGMSTRVTASRSDLRILKFSWGDAFSLIRARYSQSIRSEDTEINIGTHPRPRRRCYSQSIRSEDTEMCPDTSNDQNDRPLQPVDPI